jgi:predicted PurR-regulated permease PerM
VLRVLQDYVIYPRLIGSGVHLHPFAVILAVLAGAEIGGVIGVLLSVPTLAVGSAVYHWRRGD